MSHQNILSSWVYNTKCTHFRIIIATYIHTPHVVSLSIFNYNISYTGNVPMYMETLLHSPSHWSFWALTSNSYIVSGLRPFSLVRWTHVAGESTVTLAFLNELPAGLKWISYVFTSTAVLTLLGLSQFRVREGMFVSRVDLRFWTCPGTRAAGESGNQ